ncbi:multidrug transporter EmrE-like cation transporter [Priestia megaterium]
MYWIYLCLAILFEVAGTTTMKLSDGFTKIMPSVLLILFDINVKKFRSFNCLRYLVRYGDDNYYGNWIYVL